MSAARTASATALLVPADAEPVHVTIESIVCRNIRPAPGAHPGIWTADVQVTVEALGPHGEPLLGERVFRLRLGPLGRAGEGA